MATADAKNGRLGGMGGFFTIYKPGQGTWVRWGTVAALGIIVLFGAYTLAIKELATQEIMLRTAVTSVWVIIGALLTFWVVNSTRLAEFMIMTESEMRKVSWPTRREVINSTKVVIILTLILGLLLCLVDLGFLEFFKWIGIA